MVISNEEKGGGWLSLRNASMSSVTGREKFSVKHRWMDWKNKRSRQKGKKKAVQKFSGKHRWMDWKNKRSRQKEKKRAVQKMMKREPTNQNPDSPCGLHKAANFTVSRPHSYGKETQNQHSSSIIAEMDKQRVNLLHRRKWCKQIARHSKGKRHKNKRQNGIMG